MMASKQPRLTRQERGQVRRVANQFLAVERREFPSTSTPGKVYRAMVQQDGKMLCDCRGWTVKKEGRPRACIHTVQMTDMGRRPTRTDGEYVYLVGVGT